MEKACLRSRFPESYLEPSICDPMTDALEMTAREALNTKAASRTDSEALP